MNTVVEVLRAARNLIKKPECWTQGASARDARGRSVQVGSKGAVRFCALGAIDRVCRPPKIELNAAAHTGLRKGAPDVPVSIFNDSSDHDEVLVLFDRAIELAEST